MKSVWTNAARRGWTAAAPNANAAAPFSSSSPAAPTPRAWRPERERGRGGQRGAAHRQSFRVYETYRRPERPGWRGGGREARPAIEGGSRRLGPTRHACDRSHTHQPAPVAAAPPAHPHHLGEPRCYPLDGGEGGGRGGREGRGRTAAPLLFCRRRLRQAPPPPASLSLMCTVHGHTTAAAAMLAAEETHRWGTSCRQAPLPHNCVVCMCNVRPLGRGFCDRRVGGGGHRRKTCRRRGGRDQA